MSYQETKVYFDGSHYIAIPHTTRPSKKRYKKPEEVIDVVIEEKDSVEIAEPSISSPETSGNVEKIQKEKSVKVQAKMTHKELFNLLYSKYIDLPRKQRSNMIVKEMQSYFPDMKNCEMFVRSNMERKQRNIICRRVRMTRKANLVNFNYFVTFTYDENLHTEHSFRKKLKNCLSHFSSRKKWKYIGVWERAPKTKRLHFHGLFSIPENTMPGLLEAHSDYSFSEHKSVKTFQNTYFNANFGRSDFEAIKSNKDMMREVAYIMKYIEKTEEKIVYSKGLYQYFISDIMDEDVVSTIGQEEKKLLLFDDFRCWDEGVLIGRVNSEIISQMRKCN